jgi:branched-chain amino acid transport system permease protein
MKNIKVVATVAVAAGAILVPPFVSSGLQGTLALVAICAIGVVGLNVLSGHAGQLSLGHALFLGIGAYTAAVLGGTHGLSAAIWIPAAGVIAGVVGFVTAPVAVRLRGLYLAIVTLGLVYIGQHIFTNWTYISGGAVGRSIPAVALGPYDFSAGNELRIAGVTLGPQALYYYLALALLALSLVFVANLSRSRFGRAMYATRDGELAAAVLGIDLTWTKLAAFTISSFFAGVCGALFASYLTYVQPGQWNLVLSVEFLVAVIVGGMGTVWGPVIGSAFVFALPDLLAAMPFATGTDFAGMPIRDATALVYGVVIIAVFLLEPRGIVGLFSRLSPPSMTPKRSPSETAVAQP